MRRKDYAVSVGGLALILLVLLISSGVSRAADEQTQLDALTQALQEKGEPALPADFSSKAVPAAEDAVPDLLAGAKLIDSSTAAWKAWDALDDAHFPPPEREAAVYAAIVAENSPVLALLDKALIKKQANWNIKVTSPVVHVLLPELNQVRMAANLLKLAAFDAYARGDHRAAVVRVRQLLALSRLVDREPFLISHLVATGIGAVAYDAIFEISTGLRVESAAKPDATGCQRPAIAGSPGRTWR